MIYSIILLLLMVSPVWAASTVPIWPKPKPPNIEWGPCVEWEVNRTTISFTADNQYPRRKPSPCTRQLGFGSDGKVYWRDPRKGESE